MKPVPKLKFVRSKTVVWPPPPALESFATQDMKFMIWLRPHGHALRIRARSIEIRVVSTEFSIIKYLKYPIISILNKPRLECIAEDVECKV